MEKQSLRNADLVCSQTKYHIPIIKETFNLSYNPIHLPNPIEVPDSKLRKSEKPTVLFLARFDPVKRPWIFLQIAKQMPNVHFLMAGKSHDESYEKKIRGITERLPNIDCLGYIVEEEKKQVLERSWVMLNCSLKEALPITFLEACAHKCAIVSCQNPDGFASNFGSYIKNGEDVDEYIQALKSLVYDESKLKKMQQSGYDYVKETHELNKVVDKHLMVYRFLLLK